MEPLPTGRRANKKHLKKHLREDKPPVFMKCRGICGELRSEQDITKDPCEFCAKLRLCVRCSRLMYRTECYIRCCKDCQIKELSIINKEYMTYTGNFFHKFGSISDECILKVDIDGIDRTHDGYCSGDESDFEEENNHYTSYYTVPQSIVNSEFGLDSVKCELKELIKEFTFKKYCTCNCELGESNYIPSSLKLTVLYKTDVPSDVELKNIELLNYENSYYDTTYQ
jgi:hypothetical protein